MGGSKEYWRDLVKIFEKLEDEFTAKSAGFLDSRVRCGVLEQALVFSSE